MQRPGKAWVLSYAFIVFHVQNQYLDCLNYLSEELCICGEVIRHTVFTSLFRFLKEGHGKLVVND